MDINNSHTLPGKRLNWLLSVQEYYHNTKQRHQELLLRIQGALSALPAVTTGTGSILLIIIIIIINRTVNVFTNTVSLSTRIIYTAITLFMLSLPDVICPYCLSMRFRLWFIVGIFSLMFCAVSSVDLRLLCQHINNNQERQCTYNVILTRVRATTVAVEQRKYYIF